MKNILIPIDFSPSSDLACEYGLQVAQKANAKVTILHIKYTPVDWVHLVKEGGKNFPKLIESIKSAQAEMERWENTAKEYGLDVETKLIFDEGQSKIVHHVTQSNHDFIIMAAKGDAKSGTSTLGNMAQKIIRNANVPVLLIKNKMPKMPMKKVVFASDFEPDLSPHFNHVVDFVKMMDADIDLVFINTPYQFENTSTTMEKMNQFTSLCSPGRKCNTNIYNARNREEGIIEFTDSIDADVIAISTRAKRGGFLNFLSRSVTESLVLNPDIPLLSINLPVDE